jgi:hypothetical protein
VGRKIKYKQGRTSNTPLCFLIHGSIKRLAALPVRAALLLNTRAEIVGRHKIGALLRINTASGDLCPEGLCKA